MESSPLWSRGQRSFSLAISSVGQQRCFVPFLLTTRGFARNLPRQKSSFSRYLMGNTTSTDPELLRLQKRFSPSELKELEHLFRSLAVQSRTGGTHIIASVFQSYFGIHGALGSTLFKYITRNDKDELLSFEEFIAAKAVADKGSDEELEHFTFSMADVLQSGSITRLEADAVVSSALLTAFGPGNASLSDDLISAFLGSAEFKGPQIDLDSHPLCRQCSGRTASSQDGSGRDLSGQKLNGSGRSPSSSRQRGPAEEGGLGLFTVGSAISAGEESCGDRAPSEKDSSYHGSGAASVEQLEERMDDLWTGSSDSLTHLGESARTCSRDSLEPSSSTHQEEGCGPGDNNAGGSGRPKEEASGEGGGESIAEECKGECGRHPSMREEDLKAWMEKVPVLKKFLRSLLALPTIVKTVPGRLLPKLEWPAAAKSKGGKELGRSMSSFRKGGRFLMSDELAWHLSGMLQEKEAEGPWRLQYSSSLHGLSFSTFMGKVGEIPVPGALVVRDKGGAVFGAVFSQPLHRKSTFFGDMKTFLFSFLPAAAVYKPSGINQNIQWVGHFGLFLDSTLDRGQSWPCMTFRSPSLSQEPLFDVDVIECWSLGQPEEEEEEEGRNSGHKKPQLKGTILERFKEEKALLGFAGMATATDSLSKEDTS